MRNQLFNTETKTRTVITIDDSYLIINQYDRFNKATSVEMNNKEAKQLKEMLDKVI